MPKEKIRFGENIVGVIKRNGKVIKIIETTPSGSRWERLKRKLGRY